MNIQRFAIICLLAISCPVLAGTKSVAGKYENKWANKAGCTLKVDPKSESSIEFFLSCNRGAPSYNSGEATGTITLINNIATYKRIGSSGPCEIIFKFKNGKVEVDQNGSDAACGFGWGVYADGTYLRKASK